jgi:hypothetical protein
VRSKRKQRKLARSLQHETGELYTQALRRVEAQEATSVNVEWDSDSESPASFLARAMSEWPRDDARWIFRCWDAVDALSDRAFSLVPADELSAVADFVSNNLYNTDLYRLATARTLISYFDAAQAVWKRGRGSDNFTCQSMFDAGVETMFARWERGLFQLCICSLEPKNGNADPVYLYEQAGVETLLKHASHQLDVRMVELEEVRPVMARHLQQQGWLDARLVPGSHYHNGGADSWRSYVRFFPEELHASATQAARADPWAEIKHLVPRMQYEPTRTQTLALLDDTGND